MTSKYALMPRIDNDPATSWDQMQENDRVWNIYASDDHGEGLARIGIIYAPVGSATFRAEFNHASECPAQLRGLICPEPITAPEQLDGGEELPFGRERRSLALAHWWAFRRLKALGVNIFVRGDANPY
jgi:hypothetical protein